MKERVSEPCVCVRSLLQPSFFRTVYAFVLPWWALSCVDLSIYVRTNIRVCRYSCFQVHRQHGRAHGHRGGHVFEHDHARHAEDVRQ